MSQTDFVSDITLVNLFNFEKVSHGTCKISIGINDYNLTLPVQRMIRKSKIRFVFHYMHYIRPFPADETIRKVGT